MCFIRKIKEKNKQREKNSREAMLSIDENDEVTRGFMDFATPKAYSKDEKESKTEALPINVSSRNPVIILTDKTDGNITHRSEISGRVVIGKDSSSCQIVISDDKAVSRRHCVIEERGRRFSIIDNNSTNGTFLNGERLSGRIPLKEGDVVKIGRREYIFTFK